MALTRRSGSRFTANIWPGFVDAMTALLLVLMFVLSIFMIVQSMLRNTVSTQETELNDLAGQVASLAEALGLEQQESDQLETQVGLLNSQLDDASQKDRQQSALIASLTIERDTALDDISSQAARIADFEAQVASLLALNSDLTVTLEERDTALVETEEALSNARASLVDLEEANAREISQKEALQLALAKARTEIDQGVEEARLAAARAEAMNALIEDLRADLLNRDTELAEVSNTAAENSEAAKLERAKREALEAMVAALRTDLEDLSEDAKTKSIQLVETLALLSSTRGDLKDAEQTLTTLNANGLQADLNRALDKLSEAEQEKLVQIAAVNELRQRLKDAQAQLSETEIKQLADAAAAEALRKRLENADAELTAMTLNLEAQRRRAEETLTLLAAARAANLKLQRDRTAILTDGEREQIALLQAQELLSKEKQRSAEAILQVELLNQQTSELRRQLGSLQALLDDAKAKDLSANVQIESLGKNLNSALARLAADQKRLAAEQAKIAEFEAAEVLRLAAEAQDLRRYRSEFFGRVSEILGDREGVRVQGDRFVFSSEVLFPIGSANLGVSGERQIARVADVLRQVASEIPEEINWILRVDGHTDKSPLGFNGVFADNWELSQARALSVVRFLIDFEGIPANRLAATGFGEFQPIDLGDDPSALARNRRIELKFTEK